MNAVLRHLHSVGWGRLFAVFMLVWATIVIFAVFPMLQVSGGPLSSSSSALSSASGLATDARTLDRLAAALADLDALRKQNVELQEILRGLTSTKLKPDQRSALENFQNRLAKVERDFYDDEVGYVTQKDDPSTQYEQLRRRIGSNIREFWNFVSFEVEKVRKQGGSELSVESRNTLKHILDMGIQHKRWLMHDMEKLAEADGYATWREKEANDLEHLVQERFRFLQNPTDCTKAKKIVCNLNKGCGYGCQLHHVVYCFMVAYGTQRTLVLKSKGWRYHKSGWDEVFKPLSETCTNPNGESVSNWPGNPDTQVLVLPIIDAVSPKPPYLPMAIPEDLAPRLVRLHGNPIVWWVGQFLKYLLRPQEKTSSMIQNAISNLGFKRPIVGVHVRRTDKVGTEASFHNIEEYMAAVDEYYDQLALSKKVDKRRIYLATDDPKVINEARTKYPNYEILGDSTISKTAAVSTRYTDTSLQGIIVDIHMLSMSDYLVCTFSSQVCRIAYEIMQNYFPDATERFKSLDDIYYYGGQTSHNRLAVLPHESQRLGEISMRPGDLIGIAGNHWNGYSKGTNLRTNQVGLFPSFKVKEKVEVVKFPTYSEMYSNGNNVQNGDESS